MKHHRFSIALSAAVVLLIFFFLADIAVGSVAIPVRDLLRVLFSSSDTTWHTIVWQLRFPKAVTCVLAGASLAGGGLIMQTLFRNPLAGPDVLGLSSGASLAVGVVILTARSWAVSAGAWTIAVAAGIGATTVLALMLMVSRSVRDTTSLLVIGLMLAAATSSLMSVLLYLSRAEDLQLYVLWTLGSVHHTRWPEVAVLAIFVLAGGVLSASLIKSLNGWLLGENYARSLGIVISRTRWTALIAAGLFTGAVTAFCGPIAFVGLAVPYLARLVLKTTNHRLLLPLVLVGGGLLLLGCDVAIQVISPLQAIPLNALTALIGAPLVIAQILRAKKLQL